LPRTTPPIAAPHTKYERRHPPNPPASHSFELTGIGGKSTSGVINDVVMLGGYQTTEPDFIADDPRPTLFHCHRQLHMDYGLWPCLAMREQPP